MEAGKQALSYKSPSVRINRQIIQGPIAIKFPQISPTPKPHNKMIPPTVLSGEPQRRRKVPVIAIPPGGLPVYEPRDPPTLDHNVVVFQVAVAEDDRVAHILLFIRSDKGGVVCFFQFESVR
jgi:hypothetical protein